MSRNGGGKAWGWKRCQCVSCSIATACESSTALSCQWQCLAWLQFEYRGKGWIVYEGSLTQGRFPAAQQTLFSRLRCAGKCFESWPFQLKTICPSVGLFVCMGNHIEEHMIVLPCQASRVHARRALPRAGELWRWPPLGGQAHSRRWDVHEYAIFNWEFMRVARVDFGTHDGILYLK